MSEQCPLNARQSRRNELSSTARPKHPYLRDTPDRSATLVDFAEDEARQPLGLVERKLTVSKPMQGVESPMFTTPNHFKPPLWELTSVRAENGAAKPIGRGGPRRPILLWKSSHQKLDTGLVGASELSFVGFLCHVPQPIGEG